MSGKFDPTAFGEGDIVRLTYYSSHRNSKQDRTVVGTVTRALPGGTDPGYVVVSLESGERYTATTDGRVSNGAPTAQQGMTVGYAPRIERVPDEGNA